MKYKYNKKLGFFIRHSKTLSDRRVNLNSELKGENYGRNGSNGICFWDGRSACIHSFDKTNKDLKRKRNSRRGLQGTVIHCLCLNSDRRVAIARFSLLPRILRVF